MLATSLAMGFGFFLGVGFCAYLAHVERKRHGPSYVEYLRKDRKRLIVRCDNLEEDLERLKKTRPPLSLVA